MPERQHYVSTRYLDQSGLLVKDSIGVIRVDVSTGSAFLAGSIAYASTAMDLVVDMNENRITLGSTSDVPSWPFVDIADLHPAVAAARAYLSPGDRKAWEVFSSQCGESRFIGEFETPERATEQGMLPSPTDAVSVLPLRSSVVSVEKATQETFNRLAGEWKRTRNGLSSGVDMFMHPAYQKIIGMGEKVLPLIFGELHREIDHWFWALKAITQVDAVPSRDVGNLAAMRTHWLTWASNHGYQWQPNYTSTRSIAELFLR